MSIGVYSITNLVNGKRYIGSTIVSFIKRKNHHFHNLNKNKHSNSYLQNAWNKYGKDNFKFEIIENCKKEEVLAKELYYIMLYNSFYNQCGYNIQYPGEGSRGIKLSNGTKEKISEAHKGKKLSQETKDKIRDFQKGRKKSKEHSIRMSKLHKGKNISKEVRLKMSKSRIGIINNSRKISILQFDKQDNFIKEWESITEACKYLKLSNSAVSNNLKQLSKYCGGFKFKYKTK